MKYVMFVILGAFVTVVIVYLLMVLFNDSILRSNLPKPIKLFVQTFVPPQDLYQVLIKEKFDLSQEKLLVKRDFTHKYPGQYSFGIFIQNTPNDFYFNKQNHRINSTIVVNFFVGGKKIKSYVLREEFSPFVGKNGNGLMFNTYDCPKDLPIDKLITCEVILIKPDSQFYDSYGPIYFYVKKRSDK